jgi:hypothetical protein
MSLTPARVVQLNLSANTDAQMRPLPSVAPGFVRRLPLRYVARESGISASASSRVAAVDGPPQAPSSQILLSHTLRCRESG